MTPIQTTRVHCLLPSALFTSPQPWEVTTILGSCVALCLWDKQLQMGGINHYMMPRWNGEGLATPRYGNIAIDKLVNKMLGMGSTHEQLVAKVFGGAHQLNDGHSVFNIGERNVDIARVMLEEYKIPITGMHVGGTQGRRLRFFTATGEVWVKAL